VAADRRAVAANKEIGTNRNVNANSASVTSRVAKEAGNVAAANKAVQAELA